MTIDHIDKNTMDKMSQNNNPISKTADELSAISSDHVETNLPHDIADSATNLFVEYWFDKNENAIKHFIKSMTRIIHQKDKSEENNDNEKDIENLNNIKSMMEGIGISKKYLLKIISSKEQKLESPLTKNKYEINTSLLSAIREAVRTCFYLKCGDLLHKIEEEDGMFPWTKTLQDAELAVVECLAMAAVQHENMDLCVITKLIISNQNIWRNHFKGAGFIGYIRFLGLHPLRRRHQHNLLEPIKNLVEDLRKEDSKIAITQKGDNNNTNGSGHFSNFSILSKLLQKCLHNIVNKNKWITTDGSDAYKSKEVIEMFRIINEVYMSLPQGDPASAVTHDLFYKILLRRCSLVNLWQSIKYGNAIITKK